MTTDLIQCPCCGSDACSVSTDENDNKIYLCWTCGMTTNSLMEDFMFLLAGISMS